MVEYGFYFTIGVEVMFSQHIQNIARYLPSELMFTETDNPGGYKSITGTVGTPLLIEDVVGKLAAIRGTSEQTIVTTVQNNLIRIGGNDPWLARLPSSNG
jgi:TatD DNase family protein